MQSYYSSSLLLRTSSNTVTFQDEQYEQQLQPLISSSSSSSSTRLYRYSHEPLSTNSLRRDIPPILILLFFLFLIIITLSQILVVHTSRYGTNFYTMQKIQEELKQMDESMEMLLKDNVLPIDKWRLLFNIQAYIHRFRLLFQSYYKMIENDNSTTNFTIDNEYYDHGFLNETYIDNSIQTSESSYSDISNWWLKPVVYSSNELIKQVRQKNKSMNYLLNSVGTNRKILGDVKQIYEQLKEHVTSFDNKKNNDNKKRKNDTNKSWNSWKKRRTKHKRRLYCNEEPFDLRGRILDENSTFPNLTLYEVEMNYSDVRSGGSWSPANCLARHRVAIIIPYRDRLEHLTVLLYYLHPILQRQELDYKIFVSEQTGNGTYNKAVLMNAAFIYASSEYDFQCFVFHDVDLIPEDDRNMYSCPLYPRHMSVAVDEMDYKLTYEELVGGVLTLKSDHFLMVNGYSNLYWGWGAEDDDLYYRLKEVSLKIIRPPPSIGRYKMLQHTKRTPSIWNKRAKLLYSAAKRYSWDGVSSVKYNLTNVTAYPLFTHILVDVGSPPPGFS